MNPFFADAFEAELSTVPREVEAPDGELGYGRDLVCVTDLTPNLDEVDPESPEGVAQSVCRRFITERGSLIEDPDYGLNLRAICNAGITYEELRELADQAQAEAKKDDRVDHAEVTLDYEEDTSTLSIDVLITPVDPALGQFSFVFIVPEDGTPLLESLTTS